MSRQNENVETLKGGFPVVIANQTYQLQNELLSKELTKVIESLKAMDKANWQYACSIYNIINGNMFEEDFKDIETFAKAIESNKNNLYKLVNAVQFGLDNNLVGVIPVSRCYLLSTIEKFDKFKKYCDKKHIDFLKLSKHQLEEVLREYNNRRNNKAVNDSVETAPVPVCYIVCEDGNVEMPLKAFEDRGIEVKKGKKYKLVEVKKKKK